MRVRRTVFGVGVAVSILFAAAAADAFCINKKQGALELAVWKKEVPYFVSDTVTDPALLDAIDAAFRAWQDIDCSTLRFRKGGSFPIDTVPFQFHRNYAIYVFFVTDPAAYPTDAQYVTFSSHGTDVSGELNEASIALNGFAYQWSADGSKGIDIRSELMRVIAQVIGLKTSDVADSVTRDSPGEGSGTLSQDDIAAVRYLYYEDGCALGKVPDSTGCSDGGSTTGPSPSPSDPGPSPPRSSDTCNSSADCAEGLECVAASCVSSAGPFGGGGCMAASSPPAGGAPTVILFIAFGALVIRRLLKRRASRGAGRSFS